jgi:PAS domain S-box-containing protein
MQWQLSPSVITEAVTALGLLIVAIYFPWRDLNRSASRTGSLLLIFSALWILTHSLEIGTPIASHKAYFMGLQLIWGLLSLTLWLIYILHYIAPGKWQTSRTYALFAIIPLLAIAVLVTNHIYGLMWTSPGLNINNPYLPLEPVYGLFYWLSMVYMAVLIVYGSFVVINKVVLQHNFRRWEPWILILAVVIPILAAFLEVSGVTRSENLTIGLTPFISGIGVLALVLTLPRFHLQKVIPLARHTVFERISDGVVVLDMQNRVVDLNPAAEQLAGYTSLEALGLTVEQIWSNWPNQLAISKLASTRYLELVLTRAGAQRTYSLQMYIITDLKNRPANKLVILSDATERKKAEEELQASESKYRLIADNSTDVIWTMSLDGKFSYVSPSVLQLLGFTPGEVMQQNIEQVICPAFIPLIKHNLETALNTMEPEELVNGRYFEIEQPRKDGSTVWAEVNVRVLYDNGRPIGFLGVSRNITERKKAEKEKQKLEEKAQVASRLAAVGEMAAGIAHEINNPLTGVLGFSQMILERENVPEDIKENLKLIVDSSQRVADIVKRLLTFARQAKPVKTVANLNELIDNTLKLREYVLKTNNINVVTRFDPELPLSVVDPGQMQQVFLNLIVNAEQAMKKAHGNGTLTITSKKEENNIRISFQDDGPGITEENLGHLFEPFFTTKVVGEGTGLGLSLSRSIVLEHDGKMTVESEFGHGATFIVEVPIIEVLPSEVEAATPSVKAQPEAMKPGKILVIDDEPGVRALLGKILTQSGHSVDTTDDARAAMDKLDAGVTYDVILTDVRMPGMSGIELYSYILEKTPAMKNRIIFITGDVMGADIKTFLAQNNLPYLAKPFDIKLLREKIADIINVGHS